MKIIDAESQAQLADVRNLFQEYWDAFQFDPCFQNFAQEIERLPGEYAAPGGRLGLAIVDETAAGCIALRPLGSGRCEMKRLFVRHAFRGHGVGIALVQWVIEQARKADYTQMNADTMPTMQRALAMYDAIGFKRTDPYSANATPGAIYLSLALRTESTTRRGFA